MRRLSVLAAILLWSCVRNPAPASAPLEAGETIVFPSFSGPVTEVGSQPGLPYDLDGVTLRALSTALADFLPSPASDQPCWSRPESYRYRVVRQGNIIYIRIHADPSLCEGKVLLLDSGVRYAISTEGQILRRVVTGEPDWNPAGVGLDGGPHPEAPRESQDAGVPELAPVLETLWDEPRPLSPGKPDGGHAPGPGVAMDGGVSTLGGGVLNPGG
jgi:hypothetical protein